MPEQQGAGRCVSLSVRQKLRPVAHMPGPCTLPHCAMFPSEVWVARACMIMILGTITCKTYLGYKGVGESSTRTAWTAS